MIDQLTSGGSNDFPQAEYIIEISTPIKLYLICDSELRITVTSDQVKMQFGGLTEVLIGARSHHENPAGKITTPPDPEKMMEAISYLGSALKTTTCERSYPTLRGHPPEIEIGEELQVPPIVKKPETNIKIESPADYRSIYVISPIVYYFGADVVLSDSHIIRTSNGFNYSLDESNRGIEKEIKRVLKQCFFLDCLTRTEGYYKTSLYEREMLEEKINIDFSNLYKQPLPKQIEEYLTVRYEDIREYIPEWKQTSYISPSASSVEILPFLIHDLAAIRSTEDVQITRREIDETVADNDLVGNIPRSDHSPDFIGDDSSHGISMCDVIRSGERNSVPSEEYVRLPEDNSFEQTWVGDGIPVGATKSMLNAYKNRLDREPTEGNINVTVVVNDEKMSGEGDLVNEAYGNREQLVFNVDVHHQLTVDELHEVFQKDIDFLHYIGHIEHNGFQCHDGQLDATGITNVGINSFFLNACTSYQQAIGLINAGSISGIATTNPVLNSGAERVGESIAKLLNNGFSMVASLTIAKSRSIMGDNYVVIGDGGLSLTQPRGGIPSLCEITRQDDQFKLLYRTYLTRGENIGSITIPHMKNNQLFHLTSGATGEFHIGIDDIIKFLSKGTFPVKLDSKLYWSDKISMSELNR
jgi:hypothetical protein